MRNCANLLLVGAVVGALWMGAERGEADTDIEQVLSAAVANQRSAVGSTDAGEVIARLVAVAGQTRDANGGWLLPPDTMVDQARWSNGVLEIYLTIPERSAEVWRPESASLEAVSNALGDPFMLDPDFGGTRVHARVGTTAEYGSLERFMTIDELPSPDWDSKLVEEVLSKTPGLDRSVSVDYQRGPIAQAVRQPTGALTGVVVYASCGHGWTAGDSSWYLQRPVLWTMNEDYGNIDQLNVFLNYAYNAGATVVPFRPVGWQPIEIVLDNDDPGVTFAGSWSSSSASKYYENGETVSGVAYRWSTADTSEETATARYTPNITVTDFYPVYCFTVASTNRTMQTYRVSHSGGVSAVTIDHRETGSGWIWLGNYHLEAGGDNYVEITNLSTEAGVVVADAIRWGCGIGDIVRSGPGTVSGYSRDEEAQRYWAHGELGNNAVGFSSDIWDGGGDDGGDNVRTGGKWAREMNQVPAGGIQVDRWKRIHLEFHTNASTGGARGQICLITDLGATTYQEEFANILSDEVDADLLVVDEEFEHTWVDRSSATYTSSYGAIATGANGDEFDATIVELAFHDNETDTQLLRDGSVRAAMARSCTHGIIRFLSTLPGSEVPLSFPPDTPRYVLAAENGSQAVISWQPPLSDTARGDPATGYVVYQSSNGYGFGDPIVLGNVLTTTVDGLAPGEIRYFRVAATNAGGESMPSEVLAVRRPVEQTEETKRVLLVNGFDALRRWQNPTQWVGGTIERVKWRHTNSYDYAIQHINALAAMDRDVSVSFCCNEAVAGAVVQLGNYDAAIWILGNESTLDATLTSLEQTKLTDYLLDGGGLFISGADLGYDLIGQGNGAAFMQNELRTGYVADDAGTYDVSPATGGILEGIAAFDFDPANGAPYFVYTPDVLSAVATARSCLNYSVGGMAGVQFAADTYNAVTFGFPFEAITSPAARDAVMEAVVEFILSSEGPRPFDYDRDGDVDMTDFAYITFCYDGPDNIYAPGHFCVDVQGEEDGDIDLEDIAVFQQQFTGEL